MVQFGSGYAHPLDREYGTSSPMDNATNDVGVGIKDIGMSLGLGPIPNVPAIGAKLRAGQKKVELTFMGAGKGGRQGHTPLMYGKMQRQALREMQEANQVDFSTHATVGVMGLAGMDRQGNFSRQEQKRAIDEIKGAIDFAADVAQGGPVVVHTGEYFRHLSDASWNKEGKYKDKFQMFGGEAERASFRVVDTRTGQLISEARKNIRVGRPIWNMAKAGVEYVDLQGNKQVAREGEAIYIDYEGKQREPEERLPEFNFEKKRFNTKMMGWDEFVKESAELTARARKTWRDWKGGKINDEKFEKSYWTRFRDAKNEDEIVVRPEEAYIIGTLETNAANSKGWSHYYTTDFDRNLERVKRLEKAKEFYEQIEKTTDPDEKWKLKRMFDETYGGLVPAESKYPTQFLEEQIASLRGHMSHAHESGASQWAQAEETEERMRHVESSDTYALKEAYTAYAQAGIKAMMESNRIEKEQKLKRPVALAMENLFPESYGAHPDELITLIENSRKRMAEMLAQQGMSQKQAQKEAEEHIYATFDTAHCNMWWKYWKGDEKKTMEDNKKDFDKWMLEKVEELAKKKIVGHLHIVDNYGYEDDHLAPGEGNTPVKEAIAIFKKHGFKGDMVVEPGADYDLDTSGTQSLLKTWRHFGTPVYGSATGAPSRRDWSDVGYGYFGQMEPPYFVFAPYSPSEDWTLWSGVQLE